MYCALCSLYFFLALILLGIRRSFIDFQIWDFPGQVNFFDMTYDSQEIFGAVGALVFVIDAQVK